MGGAAGPSRLLFMGSGAFAAPVLEALASDPSWSIEAVLTRPDARAGRGLTGRSSPVAVCAGRLGLPVHKPARLGRQAREALAGLEVEVAVSADYGLWIPGWLLELPARGVVNVHPSMLPRYRGPAPVPRALMSGDASTGISFMLTDSGWDTGPVIAQVAERIASDDTCGSLEARLSEIASQNISSILHNYLSGSSKPCPQQGDSIHAPILSREETRLDWGLPAVVLERLVRALQPEPGASASFRGRRLEVTRSAALPDPGRPGVISLSAGRIFIGCGEGSLELLEVRPESRKRMSAAAFAAGYRPRDGEILDAAP